MNERLVAVSTVTGSRI